MTERITPTPSTRSAGSEGAEAPQRTDEAATDHDLAWNGDDDALGNHSNDPNRCDACDKIDSLLRAAPPSAPDPERLARGIAYALARADLPADGDTARDYALVLAPLAIESGWLAAPDPEGLPSVDEIRRRHSFADGRLQHPDDCPDEDHRDDLHAILARLSPVEPTDKGESE